MGEMADMLFDAALDRMFDDLERVNQAFNPHRGKSSASKPNADSPPRSSRMVDLSQIGQHPLRDLPPLKSVPFEVGDIVRREGGWTPMAVIAIKDGVVWADYCGDYFHEGEVKHSDVGAFGYPSTKYKFVLVVNPVEEFSRCRDWGNRLNGTQHNQLMHQHQKHGSKAKKSKKRKSTMKTRTELLNIAALTSDELTTVSIYLDGTKGTAGCYTFLCKRSLALSFTDENTKVLCETKHGLAIGVVKEIHPEVLMESMDEYRYRFVFAKIDVAEVKALNKWQETVADKLNVAQRKVTKRSALAALGLEDSEMLALPSLGADEVTE